MRRMLAVLLVVLGCASVAQAQVIADAGFGVAQVFRADPRVVMLEVLPGALGRGVPYICSADNAPTWTLWRQSPDGDWFAHPVTLRRDGCVAFFRLTKRGTYVLQVVSFLGVRELRWRF